MDLVGGRGPHGGKAGGVGGHRVEDGECVREDEHGEDRHPDEHRLLHSAQVDERETDHAGELERELARDEQEKLVALHPRGEQAEKGVGAARHRDRDREHVVDQERAARDDARRGREQLARHQVSAAARREERDDLRVAGADRDDRDDAGQRDEEAQVGAAAERLECLLRPVARRREPVRPEADPGEEGDQRDAVEEVPVAQGFLAAKDYGLDGH